MARNLRGPARHGYGDCIKRPGWSAAGESRLVAAGLLVLVDEVGFLVVLVVAVVVGLLGDLIVLVIAVVAVAHGRLAGIGAHTAARSEEHTSELPSLMRTSYAVFCLKKKNTDTTL